MIQEAARRLAQRLAQPPVAALPLADFIPAISPRLGRPDHLRPLVRLLEELRSREVRAVVSMPPRHGKTTTLLHAIAWHLARDPSARCAYVSYAAEFSRSQSRKARLLAQLAGVQLAEDASRLEEWRTTAGGGLIATGIGGPLTGHGVDLLFVDDPVKNRLEAESPTYRERTWEWFTDVALTRLEPGASCVVVQTRWHEDDLAGRLVREGWQYLRLPAIDDEGRALWPERWPVEKLLEIRRAIGEYSWASLYQGQPRPRGGALFNGVWTYRELPQGLRYAVGVDWAYTARTKADYSAAVVLAADSEGRCYVIEVLRKQVRADIWLRMLSELRARYPLAAWHSIIAGAEQGIVDLAAREGLSIRASRAVGDKFTRAQATAAAWNAGSILVPEQAAWLDAFLGEVLGFTGAGDEHDDQVDALVAAYEVLRPAQGYEALTIRGRW